MIIILILGQQPPEYSQKATNTYTMALKIAQNKLRMHYELKKIGPGARMF